MRGGRPLYGAYFQCEPLLEGDAAVVREEADAILATCAGVSLHQLLTSKRVEPDAYPVGAAPAPTGVTG